MVDNIIGRCKDGFENYSPKRVILIGNGAIEGGWAPLRDELMKYSTGSVYEEVMSSCDYENQIAGYLAQNVLSFHSIFFDTPIIEKDIAVRRELYLRTNELIGNTFSKSTFRLRNEIDFILRKIDDQTGVVVLNWDETIWKMKNDFPNVLHLHGRCSYPDTLILPTELTLEKYYLQNNTGLFVDSPDSLIALRNVHSSAYNWIKYADEIITWGINFNLYDSELNILLESACYGGTGCPKSVTNINPKKVTNISVARLMNCKITDVKVIIDQK